MRQLIVLNELELIIQPMVYEIIYQYCQFTTRQSYYPMHHLQVHNHLHHYDLILKQSQLLQNIVASLASSLKTSLMLLPPPSSQTILSIQMQELQHRIQQIRQNIQLNLRRQTERLSDVNLQVTKLTVWLKQIFDLVQDQTERSQQMIAKLTNQLKCEAKEFKDCCIQLQQQPSQFEQQLKEQYYLTPQHMQTQPPMQQIYLQLLRNIKDKIEVQISYENNMMKAFTDNAYNKMEQLKIRLLQTWHRLDQNQWHISHCENRKQRDPDNKLDVEREHPLNETKIEQFEIGKFLAIKHKVGRLDQANMSQSRYYEESCECGSNQDMTRESQVVELSVT